MTNGEEMALATAEKYVSSLSDSDKVKKLAEEVLELAIALDKNDEVNIREEIGDCAFILSHILSRHDTKNGGGIITQILIASGKMETRASRGELQ